MENLYEKIVRFNELKKEIEKLELEKGAIRDSLMSVVDKNGLQIASGSKVFKCDEFELQNIARTSIVINEVKAKDTLSKKRLWSSVLVTIVKIDDKKVEDLLKEGKLSVEEYDKMTDKKISYAFSVKVKPE